ncbi:MAG: NAD(P)H-dependent oxidoreductase subunit E [Planctomycetes bacterium]|nr:NAD(P)H-dependent oxidoreductase subunit E [Planctomycetota bacterium]
MKKTLDEILDPAAGRRGVLLGVLQDVQDAYNYLPADALRYVSEKLNIPFSRIYGVARFYNAFTLEPRGEHIIRVCQGTACHLKGASLLVDALGRELGIRDGETTKDMQFTFERVNCLGACAMSPVVTIDDQYHGQMTTAKLLKALEGIESADASRPEMEAAG